MYSYVKLVRCIAKSNYSAEDTA